MLGWIVLLEGTFYLFGPSKAVRKYVGKMEDVKFYYIVAFSYLIIGAYLLYFGFLSKSLLSPATIE